MSPVTYTHPKALEFQLAFNKLVDKHNARGAGITALANKFWNLVRKRDPRNWEHCPFPHYLKLGYERGAEVRN